MSAMQRLNVLGALLTFLYGASKGWSLLSALEKALLAYVVLFGAQILVIIVLLQLARAGRRPSSR
jgi:hypothetical protein